MGICAELVEPNTETVSFSYVFVGGRTSKVASRKLHGGGEEAPMNVTLDGSLRSNEERSSEDLTRRWARCPANLSAPNASNTNIRASHTISVGYAIQPYAFWRHLQCLLCPCLCRIRLFIFCSLMRCLMCPHSDHTPDADP